MPVDFMPVDFMPGDFMPGDFMDVIVRRSASLRLLLTQTAPYV